MCEPAGRRERKKRRTHDALSAAAIALFLDRGFGAVSVAEVAAAAGVSKPTLFTYFTSKEDLVLHRILDHRGEFARVVAQRPAGSSPLAAIEEHLAAGLERREPVTGLNDDREVLAYHGMVFSTPSLLGRLAQHTGQDEDALAAALAAAVPAAGELAARLAAAQIIAVRRVLARENWARLGEGRSAAQVFPDALAAAHQAFRALRRALPDYA
ncbi:transcriptional regulator, TetR family [Frankia casuarinae]|jgi:AcrR family transcriptional regulator|uniref:Transcriptional regulator, TetR family n=1 Tax=Frankia casuarinae (strain DSM 45818 / CECT 9043 / HFP020203 / CcI3) TaxID=106370 RepID=Q2JAC7_FRACC|nr:MULTISPECIES: TetR family transcriptional regulator [Frankia]ABD11765.1 transcriptional regulator, TetR family [Frankia casuarinae]ETA03395.1 transcriptional regulator, TetR family [Frankia sp. CcI6]EYT93174.1 transcriptional regulator, TetR family [Frankia casuarinae]KDA42707.1 transcriptional regulator, TetR family [Frankia sp. BMG5.23]KEZ35933.1 transcriptional regulator, TetR family [Frankia sp. CeD]